MTLFTTGDGNTPLSAEEQDDLIPDLTTKEELNEWERQNILEAAGWALGVVRRLGRAFTWGSTDIVRAGDFELLLMLRTEVRARPQDRSRRAMSFLLLSIATNADLHLGHEGIHDTSRAAIP